MDSLKILLLKAIEMVDAGECPEISSSELDMISSIIHQPKSMGRESAAEFLGVSMNKFHELRAAGIVREPRKRRGFKEKEYFLADLKEAKEKLGNIK